MGPRPRNRAQTHRFSALTFPYPASPRAVVDPTHVQTRNGQCRPYPPVFTSRRVSRPPVSARVCPRPSPTAGSLPPPTSKRYSSPLSPRSLVFLARIAIRPACAVTRKFFFSECVGERARTGRAAREGAHAEAPSPPSPFEPPLPRSIDRAEPRIRSGLERRRGSNATRPVADCSISTDDRYERARGLLSDRARSLPNLSSPAQSSPGAPLPGPPPAAHRTPPRPPGWSSRRAFPTSPSTTPPRSSPPPTRGKISPRTRRRSTRRTSGNSSRTRSDARPSPSSTTACTATTPGSASPRRR